MAKYREYETVLLKDGRIATIVEVYEPGAYDADTGHSPKDWEIVWSLTDDEIERLATKEEIRKWKEESDRQLKELGCL